jgi:hypothetical protein
MSNIWIQETLFRNTLSFQLFIIPNQSLFSKIFGYVPKRKHKNNGIGFRKKVSSTIQGKIEINFE